MWSLYGHSDSGPWIPQHAVYLTSPIVIIITMLWPVLALLALRVVPARLAHLVAATAGTARHSLVLEHAMRPLFAYLRAVVVPTAVFAATEDFGGGEELQARISRAADELAALVVAAPSGVEGFAPTEAGAARRRRSGVGVEQEVTDFSELLSGLTGD